jgi:imidazolonepropionase-like amidohydrolase
MTGRRAEVAAGIGLVAALVAATATARADDKAPIAVTHARVYLPNGRPPVDDATVVLAGGKVQAVGAGARVPAGARVIDGHGKVVTPGFIDANTTVGVVDVELEPQSNDTDTRGPMVPALRIVDGYNPRSALIPIARAGGVTSVVVAPRAGVLSGLSAFVDLAGDTVAQSVVRPELAELARVDEPAAQESSGTRGGMWLMLRTALEDARFYGAHRAQYDANGARSLSLPRASLEALLPVLRGEEPLVVTAHRASDIAVVLKLADDFKLRIVLEGAAEAWLVADDLARRQIPVVLDPLEDLPARFDRLRARPDNATLLWKAGVPVILSTFSAHQVRLLWQRAGNAVREGMDHDDAIRAVTEAPADAFRLTGYGRLEPGAVGNVVVWDGDPLQASTRVEHVFVRGREEPLETRQSLLLKRYRTLPVRLDVR